MTRPDCASRTARYAEHRFVPLEESDADFDFAALLRQSLPPKRHGGRRRRSGQTPRLPVGVRT